MPDWTRAELRTLAAFGRRLAAEQATRAALIRRAQQGDVAALTALYRDYHHCRLPLVEARLRARGVALPWVERAA